MIRKFPRASPGPKWEALQEPEPSSDDELDTEDGEVDIQVLQSSPTQTRLNAKRARDADRRMETTRDLPSSAPGTSTSMVGDNPRTQLKRKEFESLFTSKKRVRYVQAACSDQDNAMDLDLDEHAKNKGKMGESSISAPVSKTMGRLGGRQSGASLPVSSITMEISDDSSTSPPASTSAKPDFLRKKLPMKPPPSLSKRPSESTAAESSQLATRDPPSKLAGLPFDAYKRKTVPSSHPGHSTVSSSPFLDKPKTPLKPSASQPTRHPFTQKTQVIPPAEIIEISEDDEPPPPPSISKTESRTSPIKILSSPEQPRRPRPTHARKSTSGWGSKRFIPKVPIEVIEILDSDEERSPSEAPPQRRKTVGTSSGSRPSKPVQECATGPNALRGQSPHLPSSDGSNFWGPGDDDGDGDGMNVDETLNLPSPVPSVGSIHSIASDSASNPDNNVDIPASPRASSEVTDYTNDKAARGLIPLPSSSPSSISLSPPKDSYLSPTPMMTTVSLVKPSLSLHASLHASTSTTNSNIAGKPTSTSTSAAASASTYASASASASASVTNNRSGFSSLAVSSSSQAPSPAKRHSIHLARKTAVPRPMSEWDEDSDSSKPFERAGFRTKVNKGKEKETRQPSPSSSGAESIHMRSLRETLGLDSDKPVKKHFFSHIRPTNGGQTLAEAITSAGQLNRTKKQIRRDLRGAAKDAPIDLTSDVEGSVKHGPTLDEDEKALKAAIGSSRLLVNLLPTLKAKGSASPGDITAAAKVTEPIASSSREKKLSLSLSRTQALHSTIEPPESFSTKIERSLPTLSPKRNGMAPSEKPSPSLLAKVQSNLKPTRETGESYDVPMADVSSRKSTSPMLANVVATPPSTATAMAPESVPLPISPSQPFIHSSEGKGKGAASPSSKLHETALSRPQPTAAHDRFSDLLDVPSDDEEEECQALLQVSSDEMDTVPGHDRRPTLHDTSAVRDKTQKIFDTSVASPDVLSISAIEIIGEKINVSPLISEVPIRRSSRKSSRSSSSEGLGTAFEDDFGPSDVVPTTRTPTPEDQEPSTSSSPGSSKTYGGFPALTWKNFRKDLNNFNPKVYYAKDLPHALQDHINSMSEYTQMLEGMRHLFQATILENTVEDEPDAPPIEIWNSVDTQPTPPWEFFYTNHMWLGEGVPPPDIKSLVSCNCKGGCNPKSKTCACLLRQREAVGDQQLEFAYDKNGKLKIPGYPIFECNDLCGCSYECRNRVVQHGRKVSVNIAKTESKGWGVFAGPRKIPEGTYIGIYSGELLTDAVAHERGVKYNKFGRTYLFDLDFHHLREPGDHNWESSFTVDAYHAGNFTRFLNHSCDPNCRLYACYINEGNIQKPLLAIFSRRDIEPYEEICFNYQGVYPDNDDDDDDDDDDSEEDDDNEIIDPDRVKDIIYCPCRCGAKNCTGKMFK